MTMRAGCAALAFTAAACTIDARVATVGDGGAPVGHFQTLAAGALLPTDAVCAARVRRSPAEPRPGNAVPNHHRPTATEVAGLAPFDARLGYDDGAAALSARITGNFEGTTDEILQWTACKWGIDEDWVKAEAVEASGWNQTLRSDWTAALASCPPGADTRGSGGTAQCASTYGLFQVTWVYNQSAWPMLRDSTAFHADYAFGIHRACFEGLERSLMGSAPADMPYGANDYWGCAGAFFSGGWYDEGAKAFISRVKGQLAGRVWTDASF